MIEIVPVRQADAAAFVNQHHRHHIAPRGHVFCLAIADGDQIRGVAIVGRPVARFLDDGFTLEVTRTCVLPETPNANSMLYGASWRAARALGYRRLITYTRADEPGTSLRAAGWRVLAERRKRPGWDRPSRPRIDKTEFGIQRTLWEVS